MAPARIIIVLHCHLPYVRHPEHEDFLEEDWFYEAVAETYVPLLLMMRRLEGDGVTFKLVLSVTPTLCEMMSNDLLRERCVRYLDRHVELGRMEVDRTRGTAFAPAARAHAEFYERVRTAYVETFECDLLAEFRLQASQGHTELIGSAATHGLLPLIEWSQCRRAQVDIGVGNFVKHFGYRPRGFWLPECAYTPGLEDLLAVEGIRYFFVDTHGMLLGRPRPKYGVFAPLLTPSGVYAFGRDVESSHQVWSSDQGYPGDAAYRDFYSDLGFEAADDYVRPWLGGDGSRRFLGFKYRRVTGPDVPGDAKKPYDPEAGRATARRHARHFVSARVDQAQRLRDATGLDAPIIVSPYDAELFGHWWWEGLVFLEEVIRLVDEGPSLVTATASECLADGALQEGEPAESTWGDKGYYEVWVNGSNDWICPELRRAGAALVDAATANDNPDPLTWRALNQCARHLLLAQGSDWPFLMCTGTAREYATRRVREQIERFDLLLEQVASGRIDEGKLSRLEWLDDLFPELDYRTFVALQGRLD